MAALAQEVVTEAKTVFDTADKLAAAMQPHLLQQVSNSKIYQYTTRNKERKRNVPPGDVLLAAALVAGISIDERLGLARQANEIDVLRAQFAEMREEMASLRAELAGRDRAATERADTRDETQAAKAERALQRRVWAQRATTNAGTPDDESARRRNARPSRGAGR